MTKLKTKILNIASFGLLGFFAKKQAKKQNLNPDSEIKSSKNFDFDALHLIKALGDATNIKECTNTINTVTFKIIDSSLVNKNDLKHFDSRGLLINKHSVNIIFGNNAQAIAQNVNVLLAKGNNSTNPAIIELIKNSANENVKINNTNKKVIIPVAPICVENDDETTKEIAAEDFVVGDCDA